MSDMTSGSEPSLPLIVVFQPIESLKQDYDSLIEHLSNGVAEAGYYVKDIVYKHPLNGRQPWLGLLATDREIVEYVCCKLNLERSEDTNDIYHETKYVMQKSEITLGSGKGYTGFCCAFMFDENGNLTEHGVWE